MLLPNVVCAMSECTCFSADKTFPTIHVTALNTCYDTRNFRGIQKQNTSLFSQDRFDDIDRKLELSPADRVHKSVFLFKLRQLQHFNADGAKLNL